MKYFIFFLLKSQKQMYILLLRHNAFQSSQNANAQWIHVVND